MLKQKIIELKNHSGFMKYFKNTSWLFVEKILRMTVGLFVGIWVARYLGPKQFGLLSYARSFVSLFTVIATLGLDAIVVRELVKDESKRDVLLGTSFLLKLFGAIMMLVVLAIAINFTSNDKYTNILIFIIAFSTIFQSFNVIDFYFQSKVLSRYIVFANVISLFISTILKVYFILNKAPLIIFVCLILFDSFILSMGYVYFYFKDNLSIRNWKFEKKIAISLIKDSWPLILSGIAIMLYMRIDQVMIKEMIGLKELGYYSVAVRLSEIWYFIPMVITSSLFPAIISAKNKSEKLYLSRLQKLYSLMIWLAICIAIPITFFSNWIIKILYGLSYIKASEVLSINIWAGIAVFLGVASGQYLLAENYIQIAFYRTIIGAICNITLNIILMPFYGINGAAIATLISYFIAVFFVIFIPKTFKHALVMLKSIIPIWKVEDYDKNDL